jgi:DNA-directed RNA polymerase subunit RPC12/RpoP
MIPEATLRLKIACPECGRPPKLRTFPGVRSLFLDRDPDAPVQTVECRCGHRYVVTVRAFQEAA